MLGYSDSAKELGPVSATLLLYETQAALARAEKLGSGRPEDVKNPVLCLLEYNDGFRAAVLMLGGLVSEYLVAFRVNGQKEKEAAIGHSDY